MCGPGPLRAWMYRQLLRVHPASFRARHGADLLADFEDAWRDRVGRRGAAAELSFWLKLAARELSAGMSARQRRWGRGDGDRTGTSIRTDLRLAWRALARAPGLSAVVVVTLGLGIGTATTIFCLVDVALLRPLPYAGEGALTRIYLAEPQDPDATAAVTGAHFLAFRDAGAAAALAASYTQEPTYVDLLVGDTPRRVRSLSVNATYFSTLALAPVLGRGFLAEEETPSADVVVLGETLWREAFGADADVLGRAVLLDGRSHEVVGVAPADPVDPVAGAVDVYVPLDLTQGGANHADNNYLTVVARLAPGASPERSLAVLESTARQVASSAPEAPAWVPRVVPLHADLTNATRPLLIVLVSAAAVVMLIVCVNVVNINLTRATERRRELAVHAALGCRRSTMARRLVLESLVLSTGGAALAAAFAHLGSRLLPLLLGQVGPSHLWDLAIDRRVLAFLVALATLTGLLIGILPAFRGARAQPVADLRAGHPSADPALRRLRDGLAVSQVAIALVLLTGAALLVLTFERLRDVDLGFEPTGALTFQVALPETRYEAASRIRFHDAFAARAAEIAGAPVGAVSVLPATGSSYSWGTGPLSGPLGGEEEAWTQAEQRVVVGDYFDAAGIRLLGGRGFTGADRPEATHAFVINRTAAEQLFPGVAAVGQQLRVAFLRGEVVGVVDDTAVDPEGRHVRMVYHAHGQFGDNRNWQLHYVVRGRGAGGDVQALVPSLRRALAALDPQLVLFRPRPLEDVVAGGLATRRLALVLLLGFAGTAVLLALLGVYTVLSRTMFERRREIGLRMAMGATPGAVSGLVARRALLLGLAGVVIGLPGALVAGRLLDFLVFGVSHDDPVMLAGLGAAVLAVALLAAVPTIRGCRRVDPVAVLRDE